MQALHPTVMALFSQHSRFNDDPWGRLWRTVDYVARTTYGDSATAAAAGRRVRAVHKRLVGTDPVTGAEKRADEAEFLLWVHATEVESFLASYQMFRGALSPADADRYVAEMVRAAELVGLAPAGVPSSVGELSEYLDSVACLEASTGAMSVMRVILFAPPIPPAFLPIWSLVTAGIVMLLPPSARALYGIPWYPPLDPLVRAAVFTASRMAELVAPRPWAFIEDHRRARGTAITARDRLSPRRVSAIVDSVQEAAPWRLDAPNGRTHLAGAEWSELGRAGAPHGMTRSQRLERAH